MFQRSRDREELSLNLAPLIDVVFLLLIFFMVTTSFTRESQIALQLPQADGEVKDFPAKPLEISIDVNGNFFVNGRGLINNQADTLSSAISKLKIDPKLPVIISADQKSPYQTVITAMDVSAKLGYSNLSLATREKKDE